RAAKLVERTLQAVVELGVVHRQSDLPCEISEHAVVFLTKTDGSFATADHDDAKQFTCVTDRRDSQGPLRAVIQNARQPHRRPGITRDARARDDRAFVAGDGY